VGNILGGRLADRVGLRIAVVTEFLILTVIFPIFVYTSNPLWAMFMLIPIGLLNSAATGPLIVLGQTYLPNRVGFASGITLGLAFSFGGIITPVLGWIADHHGLHATFTVLAFLPIACTILAVLLPRDER
jgi:FSR family fosmidomycin resistance protein-like MFS transporter